MSEAVDAIDGHPDAVDTPPARPDEGKVSFEAFVAARSRDLWRSAWLLTGDAHKPEDLL